MGIKSMVGVFLLTLVLVSPLEAQQNQYPVQMPGQVPTPYATSSPVTPYRSVQPAYSPSMQPPAQRRFDSAPRSSGVQQGEWPNYPYPPYRNPYYGQMSPRDAISGTIDWFFALPSHLMDRFSNFLDGNVFPQVPAAQGSNNQPKPQVVPDSSSPPPPATPYSPNRP